MAVVLNGKVCFHGFVQTTGLMNSGFTAIVNKQLSARYDVLVAKAPELIKVLPWGTDFEVDIFRKPDFTALEVLSFATGGTHFFLLYQNFIPSRYSSRY
jgi:dipeptidyl-peptidase III